MGLTCLNLIVVFRAWKPYSMVKKIAISSLSPLISPFGKKLEDASILLSIASIVERDYEDTCKNTVHERIKHIVNK